MRATGEPVRRSKYCLEFSITLGRLNSEINLYQETTLFLAASNQGPGIKSIQ